MGNKELFDSNFKPILISSLETDSPIPFDLYIRSKEEFVLFLTKGKMLKAEQIERLKKSAQNLIFISRYDETNYENYIHKLLDKYELESPKKLKERSEALYESSKKIVNELFTTKITKESINSAKSVAEGILHQVQKDRRAFFSLMEVSSHDYYTYTHSINVCMYSISIGHSLKLPPLEMRLLSQGSLFHDIGKSKIDASIINKNGKLSAEEFQKIKEHPILGVKILLENGIDDRVTLGIVKEHHEKLDGKGYPSHLRDDNIIYLAQIVTVADIFDALTTERSYKKAMSTFEALSLMKSIMKNELNMDILKAFVSCFKQT
ncbi:MAG: HD-GYP domain-containing protein [Campylobacterales bacterium]